MTKVFDPLKEVNDLKKRVDNLEKILAEFFSTDFFLESATGPDLKAVRWACEKLLKEGIEKYNN